MKRKNTETSSEYGKPHFLCAYISGVFLGTNSGKVSLPSDNDSECMPPCWLACTKHGINQAPLLNSLSNGNKWPHPPRQLNVLWFRRPSGCSSHWKSPFRCLVIIVVVFFVFFRWLQLFFSWCWLLFVLLLFFQIYYLRQIISIK